MRRRGLYRKYEDRYEDRAGDIPLARSSSSHSSCDYNQRFLTSEPRNSGMNHNSTTVDNINSHHETKSKLYSRISNYSGVQTDHINCCCCDICRASEQLHDEESKQQEKHTESHGRRCHSITCLMGRVMSWVGFFIGFVSTIIFLSFWVMVLEFATLPCEPTQETNPDCSNLQELAASINVTSFLWLGKCIDTSTTPLETIFGQSASSSPLEFSVQVIRSAYESNFSTRDALGIHSQQSVCYKGPTKSFYIIINVLYVVLLLVAKFWGDENNKTMQEKFSNPIKDLTLYSIWSDTMEESCRRSGLSGSRGEGTQKGHGLTKSRVSSLRQLIKRRYEHGPNMRAAKKKGENPKKEMEDILEEYHTQFLKPKEKKSLYYQRAKRLIDDLKNSDGDSLRRRDPASRRFQDLEKNLYESQEKLRVHWETCLQSGRDLERASQDAEHLEVEVQKAKSVVDAYFDEHREKQGEPRHFSSLEVVEKILELLASSETYIRIPFPCRRLGGTADKTNKMEKEETPEAYAAKILRDWEWFAWFFFVLACLSTIFSSICSILSLAYPSISSTLSEAIDSTDCPSLSDILPAVSVAFDGSCKSSDWIRNFLLLYENSTDILSQVPSIVDFIDGVSESDGSLNSIHDLRRFVDQTKLCVQRPGLLGLFAVRFSLNWCSFLSMTGFYTFSRKSIRCKLIKSNSIYQGVSKFLRDAKLRLLGFFKFIRVSLEKIIARIFLPLSNVWMEYEWWVESRNPLKFVSARVLLQALAFTILLIVVTGAALSANALYDTFTIDQTSQLEVLLTITPTSSPTPSSIPVTPTAPTVSIPTAPTTLLSTPSPTVMPSPGTLQPSSNLTSSGVAFLSGWTSLRITLTILGAVILGVILALPFLLICMKNKFDGELGELVTGTGNYGDSQNTTLQGHKGAVRKERLSLSESSLTNSLGNEYGRKGGGQPNSTLRPPKNNNSRSRYEDTKDTTQETSLSPLSSKDYTLPKQYTVDTRSSLSQSSLSTLSLSSVGSKGLRSHGCKASIMSVFYQLCSCFSKEIKINEQPDSIESSSQRRVSSTKTSASVPCQSCITMTFTVLNTAIYYVLLSPFALIVVITEGLILLGICIMAVVIVLAIFLFCLPILLIGLILYILFRVLRKTLLLLRRGIKWIWCTIILPCIPLRCLSCAREKSIFIYKHQCTEHFCKKHHCFMRTGETCAGCEDPDLQLCDCFPAQILETCPRCFCHIHHKIKIQQPGTLASIRSMCSPMKKICSICEDPCPQHPDTMPKRQCPDCWCLRHDRPVEQHQLAAGFGRGCDKCFCAKHQYVLLNFSEGRKDGVCPECNCEHFKARQDCELCWCKTHLCKKDKIACSKYSRNLQKTSSSRPSGGIPDFTFSCKHCDNPCEVCAIFKEGAALRWEEECAEHWCPIHRRSDPDADNPAGKCIVCRDPCELCKKERVSAQRLPAREECSHWCNLHQRIAPYKDRNCLICRKYGCPYRHTGDHRQPTRLECKEHWCADFQHAKSYKEREDMDFMKVNEYILVDLFKARHCPVCADPCEKCPLGSTCPRTKCNRHYCQPHDRSKRLGKDGHWVCNACDDPCRECLLENGGVDEGTWAPKRDECDKHFCKFHKRPVNKGRPYLEVRCDGKCLICTDRCACHPYRALQECEDCFCGKHPEHPHLYLCSRFLACAKGSCFLCTCQFCHQDFVEGDFMNENGRCQRCQDWCKHQILLQDCNACYCNYHKEERLHTGSEGIQPCPKCEECISHHIMPAEECKVCFCLRHNTHKIRLQGIRGSNSTVCIVCTQIHAVLTKKRFCKFAAKLFNCLGMKGLLDDSDLGRMHSISSPQNSAFRNDQSRSHVRQTWSDDMKLGWTELWSEVGRVDQTDLSMSAVSSGMSQRTIVIDGLRQRRIICAISGAIHAIEDIWTQMFQENVVLFGMENTEETWLRLRTTQDRPSREHGGLNYVKWFPWRVLGRIGFMGFNGPRIRPIEFKYSRFGNGEDCFDLSDLDCTIWWREEDGDTVAYHDPMLDILRDEDLEELALIATKFERDSSRRQYQDMMLYRQDNMRLALLDHGDQFLTKFRARSGLAPDHTPQYERSQIESLNARVDANAAYERYKWSDQQYITNFADHTHRFS